ncbi:hypothetical protein [Streptomyces sp. NPDC048361]|uniref:hypothetical protein n=1 Tax=Streptomyces sp. NPDC048361 TaxID=3154720 RepID=UPI00341A2423
MPIDPFAALNAMIRAEAARIQPAGPGAPEEEVPTERGKERRREQHPGRPQVQSRDQLQGGQQAPGGDS